VKLVSEIEQWRVGAAIEFGGDPAKPICQIFARFVENAPDVHEDLLAWWNGDHFMLGFGEGRWLPIQVADEPQVNDEGELEVFRIKEISAGVWALSPSLNIQGFIHSFVIIYGVPTPAPWVSRIVVVQSIGRL
jgi:hypothetical protein